MGRWLSEKTEIVPVPGGVLEYKNLHFADIYTIRRGNIAYGYYYEDRCEQKKWYTISIPHELHPYFASIVKEQYATHFGEDCIYCHGIYQVDLLIDRLIELKAGHLPVTLKQVQNEYV